MGIAKSLFIAGWKTATNIMRPPATKTGARQVMVGDGSDTLANADFHADGLLCGDTSVLLAPATDGSSGEQILTDGAGNLYFGAGGGVDVAANYAWTGNHSYSLPIRLGAADATGTLFKTAANHVEVREGDDTGLKAIRSQYVDANQVIFYTLAADELTTPMGDLLVSGSQLSLRNNAVGGIASLQSNGTNGRINMFAYSTTFFETQSNGRIKIGSNAGQPNDFVQIHTKSAVSNYCGVLAEGHASQSVPVLGVKEDGDAAGTVNGGFYADGRMVAIQWLLNGSLSADPSNPANGEGVAWISDGTGTGDDGDLVIKITNTAGTTKTGILFDHSAA